MDPDDAVRYVRADLVDGKTQEGPMAVSEDKMREEFEREAARCALPLERQGANDYLDMATSKAWHIVRTLTQQPENLAPGVMRCAKCDFQMIRNNLNINVGTVTAGDSKTEPCPNGCGPLWPVTWKQRAQELEDMVERLFEELQALKSQQPESEPFAIEVIAKAAETLGKQIDDFDGDGTEESLALEAIDQLIAERSQPTPQVPEGWREAIRRLKAFVIIHHGSKAKILEEINGLLAPSIAEEREPISCEERSPTYDDSDFTGRVFYWRPNEWNLVGWNDPRVQEKRAGNYWVPTGLVRPEPPTTGGE